jgi:hypothetical protein
VPPSAAVAAALGAAFVFSPLSRAGGRERCHAKRDREGVFPSLPLQRERCRRAAATERVALAAFALGGTDLQIGAAFAPFFSLPLAGEMSRRFGVTERAPSAFGGTDLQIGAAFALFFSLPLAGEMSREA